MEKGDFTQDARGFRNAYTLILTKILSDCLLKEFLPKSGKITALSVPLARGVKLEFSLTIFRIRLISKPAFKHNLSVLSSYINITPYVFVALYI